MKIKAALCNTQQNPPEFKIQEVDIIEPRQNEVRIKIVSAGICHTDIAYATDEWGIPIPLPMVLGHVGAGSVESVGPGVTKVKPGDHVVISIPSCGCCEACNTGKSWFCAKTADLSLLAGGFDFFDTTPLSKDGEPVHILFQQSSFAEYVVTNHRSVVKIPDDMDLKDAGPLSCGLHTGAGGVYSVLKPQIGEWVLVTGAGAVGLAAVWMAKAMGAKVCLADIADDRLQLAKETGADAIVNTKGMSQEEMTAALKEAMDGAGAHCLLEACGVTPVIKAAMLAVRAGGRICQAAVGGKIEFDSWFFGEVDSKEITFSRMGNVSSGLIIPILCELYKEGKFPINRIYTYYSFNDIQKAVDEYMAGKAVKPVLLFD